MKKKVLLVLAAVVAASFCSAPAQAAPAKKPNVLFIAVDDLNHWVGYLGRNPQTKTPNLDRLAARGVWFTHSYCASPVCNPSRAALMSGLRPGTTGVYENDVYYGNHVPTDITLTTTFRKAGYYVCGAGKIYHNSDHRAAEWDDYLNKADHGSEDKGGRDFAGKLDITPLNCDDKDMPDYSFVDYGIKQLNAKHDQPYFIAVGLVKPHLPWSVPKKYYAQFDPAKADLPPYRADDLDDIPPAGVKMALSSGDHAAIMKDGGTNAWKKAIAAYLASISFCDAMIGRLLDAYDKSPERDNTIICFWSDHGWSLGEKNHWRKFALWEEPSRAPHIWVVPGLTPANGRCDRTIDYMSMYPTLCDLCGIPTPSHVQGKSIKALLADPKAAWSTPAVTTYKYKNHTVRSEDWRYIQYADGGEELYDETKDPYEYTNLATKSESTPRKQDLSQWLPKENVPTPPSSGKGGEGEGGGKGKKGGKKGKNKAQ